jgi:hypothetical protein
MEAVLVPLVEEVVVVVVVVEVDDVVELPPQPAAISNAATARQANQSHFLEIMNYSLLNFTIGAHCGESMKHAYTGFKSYAAETFSQAGAGHVGAAGADYCGDCGRGDPAGQQRV